MYIVYGVQRKSGEYQGNHYDNLVLHCLNQDPTSPMIQGVPAEIVKIKMQNLLSCFSGLVSDSLGDLASLVGMAFNLYFDKFGNCIKADAVEIEKEGGAKT